MRKKYSYCQGPTLQKKKTKEKKGINEWLIRKPKVEKEMGLCSDKSTKT